VLFQKTEHIISPHGASQVREAMGLPSGFAERGIDLHLEYLAGVFHGLRKSHRRSNLVADIRTRRRAEPLSTPVRCKEHSSTARKHRSKGLEGRAAEHSWSAAVVVNDCSKRSRSLRLVQHSIERELSTGKRGHLLC